MGVGYFCLCRELFGGFGLDDADLGGGEGPVELV